MADNYEIYESEIDSKETLKIREKSIFLSNIYVKGKIISYKNLIIFGDVKAEYLLVSGNLVVLGKIDVKEVDIEGCLIYSQDYEIEKLEVTGEIVFVDKFKNNDLEKINDYVEHKRINSDSIYTNIKDINIDNLNKNNKFLSDIIDLKSRIIDEICDNESKYYLENIYSTFLKLGDIFIEFKKYSDFIGLLLSKYRSKSRCDMNLINYLKVVNYKLELPSWLLKISYIKEILNWIDQLNIEDMVINLNNESEINEIKYLIYKCKNKLGNQFDEIFSMIDKNKL